MDVFDNMAPVMMRHLRSAAFFFFALVVANGSVSAQQKIVVENERVVVRDVNIAGANAPSPNHALDTVLIDLKDGGTTYVPRGQHSALESSGHHFITVDLKDHPVAVLPNKSGFPNAFPRPGVKKVLENERVVIWDYTWAPGVATPMHFHDKDVVVVYLADGALKSTTPTGEETVNPHTYGYAKFNPRDRVHTETLIRGKARAIIVELK